MKTTKGNNTKQSKQGQSHVPRPQIRDDKDSRKNREEGFTGDVSKKGDKVKKHK